MKSAIISVAVLLSAGAAYSGGYQAPVVETAPAPAVAADRAAPGADWTGFYAGVQYGQGNAEVSAHGMVDGSPVTASADQDFDAYGLHAGYQRDFGQYVLGGEIDYNRLEGENEGEADLWRLKGRAGVDLGRFQPYVIFGLAHYSEPGLSENGAVYGLGVDYRIADRFTAGVEYTHQAFDDILDSSGLDLDGDAVQLRASFRF